MRDYIPISPNQNIEPENPIPNEKKTESQHCCCFPYRESNLKIDRDYVTMDEKPLELFSLFFAHKHYRVHRDDIVDVFIEKDKVGIWKIFKFFVFFLLLNFVWFFFWALFVFFGSAFFEDIIFSFGIYLFASCLCTLIAVVVLFLTKDINLTIRTRSEHEHSITVGSGSFAPEDTFLLSEKILRRVDDKDQNQNKNQDSAV
eukprot:gb/GECH01011481.1/.p1 GENE.gb/GECH01011481.1/~~gb/GECH01011481.1/.p1  ORF type:complete len:201 (+),score=30.35 gb/GECH01011481.1/:1-603(+)